MKTNDWIAVNLNIQDTPLTPDSLRLYNISPDNTGIKDKDYYKNIPRVQETFKNNDGSFNEEAFSAFYDSAKRSYTDFATNDYVNNLIQSIPTSANDIFSLGNINIEDNTAHIVRTRDPQRHAVGISNLFETGDPSFSEREVAQSNRVLDENGNQLNWTPEDKGDPIKALFRPTLALAVWEEDGTHLENGIEVEHHKGDHKYDEWGDPMYQIVGKNEIYGRDILHYSDAFSREGSFWNKIDIFDNDGVKSSAGKTIARTVAKIAPYLTPYGYVFGGIEAAIALGQTLPVLTKAVNGFFTNDNTNGIGQKATSVENWFSRFGTSQSDEGQGRFWSLENMGQMISDSASQLYSQRLIQKLPTLVSKLSGKQASIEAMKLAQNLSLAYMATTSAQDVYGAYKEAGVNDRFAGLGALATMGAFYGFMNNDYFKEMLFRDPAMELPELKQVLSKEGNLTGKAIMQQQLKQNGLEQVAVKNTEEALKWYQKASKSTFGFLKGLPNKIKNIGSPFSTNVYVSRSFNEGLEEVMEEGATDLIKGLTLGLQSLGFNVRNKDYQEIDFGFSPEDFLSRYTSSFIGGAIGGAVFEGLTQWDNKILHKNVNRISDLSDTDLQLTWYIRNGYTGELLKIIDNWEKKGRFGSKDLSWSYKIDTDAEGNKKLVYNEGSISDNQNTAIANILRQRIRYKSAQLNTLNLMMDDNTILSKALDKVKEEAKRAGYTDLDKFRDEKLRDERIDYIRQVGIDKLIISDVADLQLAQTKLLDLIDEEESRLRNVPDSEKSKVEENIKNSDTLKRLHSELDKSKKELEDLLSGNRASEYLAIGIFAGDQFLKDLYLSDLSAENPQDTYFEASVKNYVRAKYGLNYDEIVAREGEGTKKLFDAEYTAYKAAEEGPARIRGAFNLHKQLSKRLLPVIQEQIKNYNGYKTDEERSPLITVTEGAVKWEEYEKELEAEKAKLDTLTDPADILESQQKIAELQSILNLKENPKTVLEVLFNEDTDKNSLEKLNVNNTNKGITSFLINYYTHLNKEKIVSEFSDDLLKRGFGRIAENLRLSLFNQLDADKNLVSFGILDSDIFTNVILDVNDIAEDFVSLLNKVEADPYTANRIITIIDDAGNEQEVTVLDALTTLMNLYNDGENNNFIVTFNGKEQSIIKHIADILDMFETSLSDEELENYSGTFSQEAEIFVNHEAKNAQNSLVTNKNNWEALRSKFADVVYALSHNLDNAENAYNSLVSFVQSFVDDNKAAFITTGAKNWVDGILFRDGTNVIEELNKIKALRANMIHTPILEWVKALSSDLNGFPTDLWQMLQDEQKNLYDKQRLDDYVIKDPFKASELQFLASALNAARAMNRAMLPFGANMFINPLLKEDGKEELPFIGSSELSDVYTTDLNILQERVNYLLDLHNKNKQSTIKQKKQTFVVSAPKFIKAIVGNTSTSLNEKKIPIAEKLSELGVNVEALWQESCGGTALDPDNVTEENFPAFWDAMRTFMNAVYDKVVAFVPGDGKTKTEVIVDTLMAGFTDLWKLKNSNISHKKEATIENLDVLYWLASILSVDPRTTFGLIKTVKSTLEEEPFWDQLLNIQIGFSVLENSDMFNMIIDKLSSLMETIPNLSEEDKQYMLNKAKVLNSYFVDGASGTGKSTIVLRYIREMRKLLHPEIGVLAVSQYENRANSLKGTLKVADNDTYSKTKLQELFLGRPLTSDDFEKGKNKHVRKLKDSVIEELKKNVDKWNQSILKDRNALDIYVDESGFLSEPDLEFFSAVSELANIKFIYAGDKMQNGALFRNKDGRLESSGVFDVIGICGPRLNLSMRAGNLGMVNNLNRVEGMVQTALDVYAEKPWLTAEEIWNEIGNTISPYKFKFFEAPNMVYGIASTSDASAALTKLKGLAKTENKGPKIVIITDHVDSYSSERSEDIDVLDIGSVQGGEYDYYLIDIKNIDTSNKIEYLRNVYTIISRARIGGFVVGNLGELFPESIPDNTASIVVNPKADAGENNDTAMKDYDDFFNKLFEKETWSSKPTSGSTTPSGTTAPPPPPPGTPKPLPGKTYAGPSADGGWTGLEDWKANVKANGAAAAKTLVGGINKTKTKDYDNYKKYYDLLNQHESDGTLIETKSFIDWLFNENGNNSDDILFGENNNIRRGLGALTEDQRTQFRKAVRNLSMDLFVLPLKARKHKYSKPASKAKDVWNAVDSNNTEWLTRVERLFEAVANTETLELYSVRDGDYAYLYFTYDDIAIPVARVKGLNRNGFVTINGLTQQTSVVILSTEGNYSQGITDAVKNYVDLNENAFVIKITEDQIDANDAELLRFIRQNKGKPFAYLSDTFADDDVQLILSPEKEGNDKIKRIDKTGIDYLEIEDENGQIVKYPIAAHDLNHKRFNAISKRINLETYVRLSNILYKMHHRSSVSDEEKSEVLEIVGSEIQQIESNNDLAETMRILKRSPIIGEKDRANLVGALMRYFWLHKDSNPGQWDAFRDNLSKWVLSDEWQSKDRQFLRQQGVSVTIYGDTGTSETYRIFKTDDGNYNVKVRAVKNGVESDIDIATLTPEQWVSTDLKTMDPISMVKSVLEMAKTKVWDIEEKGKTVIDDAIVVEGTRFSEGTILSEFFKTGKFSKDDDIEKLLKTGKVTIGLTTRQNKIDNNHVGYFTPFDSEVAFLLNGTGYNGDELDKFLAEDAIFKYGFIVSLAGENINGNDYYLQRGGIQELITDAAEILPPLFTFTASASNKTSVSFGALNHKIVTSDPKDNKLTIKRDDDGNISEYSLQKYFIVSRKEIEPYIADLNHFPNSSTYTIVSATPKKITLLDDSGNRITYDVSKDPIDLFKDMEQEDLGNNVLAKSGEYSIVIEDNKITIDRNGVSNGIIIAYTNKNVIGLRFGEEIVEFNVSEEVINKLTAAARENYTVYGEFLELDGNSELLYHKDGKITIVQLSEDRADTYTILPIDPNNKGVIPLQNRSGEININVSEEVFNKILGFAPKVEVPVQTITSIAKTKFKNIKDFSGIEENPNKWLKDHAAEIGRIYTWDGKEFVIESTLSNDMLFVWARANGSSIEEMQAIIDSIKSVDVTFGDVNRHEVVITYLDGKTVQFEATRKNHRSKWNITLMNSNLNSGSDELINKIQNSETLSDISKKCLLLFANQMLNLSGDSDTNTDEFNTWIQQVNENPKNYPEEFNFIIEIANLKKTLDNNRKDCNNGGM